MSRGRLLGWMRAALWSVSLLLCVAVTLCYTFRPASCALVTMYPAWSWAVFGLMLAVLSVSRASRTRSGALLLAWLAFVAFLADDVRGAVRLRRAPPSQWEQAVSEGRALRVVSLNCAGGDIEAVREAFDRDPDLLLLQESPSHDKLEELVSARPGNWSLVFGLDASIIARGTAFAVPLSPEVAPFAVRARTTTPAGAELDVVSVRLLPPVLCLNLLSPDCWRAQSDNWRSRHEQVVALLADLASTPSSIPVVLGGDFNAPAGDGSLRPWPIASGMHSQGPDTVGGTRLRMTCLCLEPTKYGWTMHGSRSRQSPARQSTRTIGWSCATSFSSTPTRNTRGRSRPQVLALASPNMTRMPNRLTIFGSAAGYPTRRRPHTTAIGLWRGEELYFFDAGAGIADQFATFDIDPDAARAIFLTHMHADHVGGLAPLLQAIQLNKRTQPLPLYLPDRSLEGIRDYLHLVYLHPLKDFDLQLHPISAGYVCEHDGLTVTAVPSYHLEPSQEHRRELGARVDSQAFSYVATLEGKRVYLSGDLDSPDEAAKHGAKSDIAVVEIAHFEPEALGEALANSGISRLVVSHVPAALEPREAELPDRIKAAGFDGKVIVATDGLTLEL